jgi:hypothetical protein
MELISDFLFGAAVVLIAWLVMWLRTPLPQPKNDAKQIHWPEAEHTYCERCPSMDMWWTENSVAKLPVMFGTVEYMAKAVISQDTKAILWTDDRFPCVVFIHLTTGLTTTLVAEVHKVAEQYRGIGVLVVWV